MTKHKLLIYNEFNSKKFDPDITKQLKTNVDVESIYNIYDFLASWELYRKNDCKVSIVTIEHPLMLGPVEYSTFSMAWTRPTFHAFQGKFDYTIQTTYGIDEAICIFLARIYCDFDTAEWNRLKRYVEHLTKKPVEDDRPFTTPFIVLSKHFGSAVTA